MTYIYLFLILFNTSSAIAFFFKRRIEETIFISIFFEILVLFLFGICFNLDIGYHFLIILNLPTFIYNMFYIIKHKKLALKESILTPGLFAFILVYILFIWINYGRMAIIWDEFSHWALVTKNMFYLDNFGLGLDSTVVFKSYLSGTSLFQYFILKINSVYDESLLFFGMCLTSFSLLLPMMKKFNNIKSISFFLNLFILIVIPTLLYGQYYTSIYVDAILGICFAAALYIYYFNYNEGLNSFNIVCLSSLTMMLVFIKDIGFYLACLVALTVLIDTFFVRKVIKLNTLCKEGAKLVLIIFPAIFIRIIWAKELLLNNIGSNFSSSLPSSFLNNLKLIFTSNRSGYKAEVIHNYLYAIFNVKLINSSIGLSFFMIVIAFALLSYKLVEDIKNKPEIKKYVIFTLVSGAGAVGYALLILLSYLSFFSEYESLMLASFERYLGTYSLGLIILSFSLLLNKYSYDVKKLTKYLLSCILFLLIFTNFNQIIDITYYARGLVYQTKVSREVYKKGKDSILKNVSSGEFVNFISTNDAGRDYWIMKYETSPKKVIKSLVDGDWSIGEPYSESDIWTVNKSEKEWSEELKKEFDYVYLFDIDEKFIASYKDVFKIKKNSKIEDNQLYKVNKKAQGIQVLELVIQD